MSVRRRVLLLLLALTATVSAAAASSSTGSVPTSAAVVSSCLIKSTTSISLGAYAPASGAALQGSGQVALLCTKGTAAAALPTGGGSALTGSGGRLTYALYTDSGTSKVWGSPVFNDITYNFSSNTALPFYFESGVSFGTCQSLANGTAFWFQGQGPAPSASTMGNCGVNLGSGAAAPCRGSSCLSTVQYGSSSSTILLSPSGTQTVLKTGPYGTGASFDGYFLPSATSTQVSGLTYTIPVSVSGSGQALTGTSTSVASPVVLSYYAKVPAGQDVPAGTYTDTVTLQVTF